MISLLLKWFSTSLIWLHPFFVSVIDINHNKQEKALEISVRVFTDDLEKTVSAYAKKPIVIQNNRTSIETDKHLAAYLQNRIKLKSGGKLLQLNYLGHEVISESTWSYFEVTSVETINELEVYCSLLHDFEQKQINIIHAKANGKENSYKLDFPNTGVRFGF
ncbi:MAG: DUF6702 family protein [Chitinophagaceae bacterium]